MSNQNPMRNYVYQPLGVIDVNDKDPKIYGVSGPDIDFEISQKLKGITKRQAQKIVDIFNEMYER